MEERLKSNKDSKALRLKIALRANILLFLVIVCVLVIVPGTQAGISKPGDPQQAASTNQKDVAVSVGTIVSEGVSLIGADQLHMKGITGKGVKVGIIDLGFAKLDQAIQHGELPKNIIAWNALGYPCRRVKPEELGAASRYAHGTAVAEIVHDVAPDAELHLYLVSTMLELGQAMQKAIDEGVQIINHSVVWFNTSFYDGTGIVDDIVKTANQNGIFWVNAAGNYGHGHYDGTFQDEDGDNFSDTSITLTLKKGSPVAIWFTWDAWPRTNEDFDLLLVKGNKLVTVSTNKQDGTEPKEKIVFNPDEDGEYQLQVKWAGQGKPPRGRRMDLFVGGGASLEMKPVTPERSIPAPGDCVDAFTVGAVGVNDWTTGKIESFSSRGPTNAGLQKPDIVAPDCVSTFTYETESSSVCGARGRFAGTAAAAPHVAGAAALLLSEDPSRTTRDLELLLKEMAIPIGDPYIYGAGLLNLK